MKTTANTIGLIAFALLFQQCKSSKQGVTNNTKVENVVQQSVDTSKVVTNTDIETNNNLTNNNPIITIEEKPTVNTTPKDTVLIVKENSSTKEIPVPKKQDPPIPKKEVVVKEPNQKPSPEIEPKGDSQKPKGKEWKVPEANVKMKSKVKADENAIASGKEIWIKECKSCHGTKGLGDGTKAEKIDISCGNFSSAVFQAQTDGEIYFKTTKGRKPMPSFEEKLDDTQRWQVVVYMRTLKK